MDPTPSETPAGSAPTDPTRGGPFLQASLRWLGFWNNILLIPLFTVMVLETSTGDAKFGSEYTQANLFFCICFLVEYFFGLALAEKRGAYLRDPSRFVDLISSIPFGYFFQGLRVVRLLRILRLVRIMWRARRFRGKGAKLVRVVGIVGSFTFAGAMALRIVEPAAAPDLLSALWWSTVTLSTVGYGDITPITPAGRIIGMVLIVAGIGVFGFMAGFMASVMADPEEDEILSTVRRLEKQLAALAEATR